MASKLYLNGAQGADLTAFLGRDNLIVTKILDTHGARIDTSPGFVEIDFYTSTSRASSARTIEVDSNGNLVIAADEATLTRQKYYVASTFTDGTSGSLSSITPSASGTITSDLTATVTKKPTSAVAPSLTYHYGVDGFTVSASGSSYSVSDVLSTSGADVTDATFTVSAVSSGGIIEGIDITTVGDWTSITSVVGNPIVMSGGAGSGATITINDFDLIDVDIDSAGSGLAYLDIALNQSAAVTTVLTGVDKSASEETGDDMNTITIA